MTQCRTLNNSSRKDLGCQGLAIESDLKENMRDIKVCTDFKMLKVKVPTIFSGI